MPILTFNEFKRWLQIILKNNCTINMDVINKEIDNYENFKDEHLENVFKTIKGDILEYISKFVFESMGIYKKVYMYHEASNVLKDTLNLPNRDEGIDLICLITDNEYIGVQCKWRRQANNTIEKRYVAELYLALNSSNLCYGIMATNVHNANLHRDINNPNNLKTVKWFLHDDYNKIINRKFIKKILGNIDGKLNLNEEQLSYNAIILRYYQVEAVNALLKCTDVNKQCIMACGTGKTIVMFEYLKLKCNYYGKILFLMPSLNLITQIYTNFINYAGNIDILCICSQMDKKTLTGDKVNSKKSDELFDEFLLMDNKNIYTTDKQLIESRIKNSNNLIVFCTYQSSKLLKDQSFDIAIFDEAHRTVNNKFSFLLDNNNCKIKERLYFTATPKYYVGDKSDIVSMSNTDTYGERVYNYTFGQAIRDKHILDYSLLFYVVNENMEDLIYEKYITKENINIDSRTIISAIQIAQHILNNNYDMKILTFHSKISKANDFRKILNYLFTKLKIDANVFVMHGKQRISERNQIISEFTNSKVPAIICSKQVLTTGVDIPCANTLMFVDPKNSLIEVTQICGRIFRPHNNSDMAYILIPVYYDKMNEEHDYKQVINILMAMDSIDKNMEDKFTIDYLTKNKKVQFISTSHDMISIEKKYVLSDVKYNVDDVMSNLRNEMINRKTLCFKNNEDEWRNMIIMENKRRYKNDEELIDTRNKCREFLKDNGVSSEFNTNNCVKHCLGNNLFDKIKEKYYYEKSALINACLALDIYSFTDYKRLYKSDIKLPSPDYINDGFYYDIDNRFSLTSLLKKFKPTRNFQ